MRDQALYILAGLLTLLGVGAILATRWLGRPGAILIGLAMLVAAEGVYVFQSWWPSLVIGVVLWPLWRLAERA
jgi:hypothetical protein